MDYPTIDEVEKADRMQLGAWYRHLPLAKNEGQLKIVKRITDRFRAMGMFTPAISKAVGWDPR